MPPTGLLIAWRWSRRAATAAVVVIAALLVGLLGPAQATPVPAVTVGVVPGTPATISVMPDSQGQLQWQVACGPDADCPDASLAVVVPWPLQTVLPQAAAPGRVETFDSSTGTYKFAFTEPLSTGGNGLPAEAVRQVSLTGTYSSAAGVVDGQRWDLTANVAASGAAQVQAYGSVVAVVPPPPPPPTPAPLL